MDLLAEARRRLGASKDAGVGRVARKMTLNKAGELQLPGGESKSLYCVVDALLAGGVPRVWYVGNGRYTW